ncbi:MAG: DUF975 family protein [Proteobacteria bacterium]|nr:DUF975 family protein [Pseudomonadota bacterium]
MQCKVCGQNNSPKARFCSKCGNALGAAAQQLSEIGVGSSYSNGRRQLWKHFLVLFLIVIITALIYAPSFIMREIAEEMGGDAGAVLFIFSMAYTILLMSPIGYGVSFVFLKAARDDPLDVKDMFEAFKNYWNAVLAGLLVGIIVVIGVILLIVPGIIFACRLAFTSYLVVDRKMQAIEAIKESWRMTNGHAWKVFLIGLLSIPVYIAGLIFFGVGIIIAIMWVSLTFASLYHAVSRFTLSCGQQLR